MGKLIGFIASTLLLLTLAIGVGASNQRTFKLPPQAKQISANVYDLGEAVDKGRKVRGLAILHPKPVIGSYHKERHKGGPGGKGGKGNSKCYSFIAKGTHWQTAEDYLVDPTNRRDLNSQAISDNIAIGMATWEAEISPTEIFGIEALRDVDGVDTSSPDGENEIMFGNIAEDNVIAVTIVWYTNAGPPWTRQIVEYDQMYDDADFNWSIGDPADPSKMDFLNIATHELGHAAGLGHPEDSCTEETMYAFADFGETKKRDLNTGDIAGIKDLYQ